MGRKPRYLDLSDVSDAQIRQWERLVKRLTHAHSHCDWHEDLKQHVRVEGVGRALVTYDASKGASLETWVNNCVRGSIKHYLRDEAPRWRVACYIYEAGGQAPVLVPLEDLMAEPGVDGWEAILSHTSLVQAMERLPAEQRQTIVLHDLMGYSYPEMEQVTGSRERHLWWMRELGVRGLRKALV